MIEEMRTAKAVPRWRRKWWMRIRIVDSREWFTPVSPVDAIQIDGFGMKPIVERQRYAPMQVYEFYVPWWAWLFELIHRAIFGHVKVLPSQSA